MKKTQSLAAKLDKLESAAADGAAVDLAGLAAAVETLCTDALGAPAAERNAAGEGLAAVVAALDRLAAALREQQEVSARLAHRRAAEAYKG